MAVGERQPARDTGGVGYSPYRKFRASAVDYALLAVTALVGLGLVIWAFVG